MMKNYDTVKAELATRRFDTENQDEDWKNKVAAELNAIIGAIALTLHQEPVSTSVRVAQATINIVDRVANFEEIKEDKSVLK